MQMYCIGAEINSRKCSNTSKNN